MLENPYKPPSIPLHEAQPAAAAPRKRFRYRLIPATLCFTFGGLCVAGWVFQVVAIAALIVRVGPARFNFGAMAIVLVGQLICFSLFLLDGWFWLKGRWYRAVAVSVAAYGIGVTADWGTRAAYDGTGPGGSFLNRFIKPAPAKAARTKIDWRFRDVNFWSMINLQYQGSQAQRLRSRERLTPDHERSPER